MLSTLDLLLFAAFLIAVTAVTLLGSRGRGSGRAEYFLAGRNLGGLLIGISLIASNISTEHFVGMTGNAARLGLAVASYEWLAAPALVVVALWLLPKFLRAGIYTIPEFLEQRYDRSCRTILAALMVVFFVLTVLATVLYSGSTFVSNVLDVPGWLVRTFGVDAAAAPDVAFQLGVWGIAFAAGIYTVIGGLRAVVLSDLLQGGALLIGGAVVTLLALLRIGDGSGVIVGWQRFTEVNADALHVVRAWNDPDIPGLSLVTGLWIPVLFYWGLNQFITQRTLAAGSLAAGQKGVLLAAAIKLAMPFLVVLPGIMAVQILGDAFDENAADATYPRLLRELLPSGLLGLMLAAVTGSILSTFNSGLNSAATVFALDLWPRIVGPCDDARAVRVGRWATVVLAICACLWTPVIHSFDGVFDYIQELWGFVSAPTCAVFFGGMWFAAVPAAAARTALWLGPLLYLLSRAPSWLWTADEAADAGGLLAVLHGYSSLAFLYHMFVLFLVLLLMLWIWSKLAPRVAGGVDAGVVDIASGPPEALGDSERALPDPRPWSGRFIASAGILVATIALYVWFW